eukprot:COSAG05_NODE_22044_length_267_cov_0.928571_1_plen_47_part_01
MGHIRGIQWSFDSCAVTMLARREGAEPAVRVALTMSLSNSLVLRVES